MKEEAVKFAERTSSERKEFRIETLSMFKRYLRNAGQLAPDSKHLSAYANALFDSLVGMIPVTMAELTELTQEAEESVIAELRNKFSVVREAIEEQRAEQKEKRPLIHRP